MEVVDAVELSLEKNRTIDVHQQQLTERLAFRGVMSALGCGLLLIGFLALVLVTIFGGAEGEGRAKVLTSWPFILLAVLALFLVLQLVPLLVGKRPRQNQATDGDQRVDRAG
jgi:FtsH-binding integral membrane protein